ncbi:antibiotic biosynthesis monooxygenase [Nocardia abscessus]|uniref:antibiotic biosynthesis monooxygenase family protein n=1 Tax=Nocardia abscessus TaxID=120957 RepID=UPI001892E726|nr:antibiotic biosynthesis monooxygenase family protein [Nocardia abscessus]MBF6339340.1 antibiotic biosynthesis monooxygenase [Nocardia abscessus]
MPTLTRMDPRVDFFDQLDVDAAPVIVINKFTVDPADIAQFLAAWRVHAAYMKGCPGFISAQMHRGIGASGTFVNMAVWESTDLLKAAVSDSDFRKTTEGYPDSVESSPHLFTKQAAPGICTG